MFWKDLCIRNGRHNWVIGIIAIMTRQQKGQMFVRVTPYLLLTVENESCGITGVAREALQALPADQP